MKILSVDKDKVQVELTKEDIDLLDLICSRARMHLQSEAIQSRPETNISLTKTANKVLVLNEEIDNLKEKMEN